LRWPASRARRPNAPVASCRRPPGSASYCRASFLRLHAAGSELGEARMLSPCRRSRLSDEDYAWRAARVSRRYCSFTSSAKVT
jgi:hypothetical protein